MAYPTPRNTPSSRGFLRAAAVPGRRQRAPGRKRAPGVMLIIALCGLTACGSGSSSAPPASPTATATPHFPPLVVYSDPLTSIGYTWSIGGACSPQKDGLHLVFTGVCTPQDNSPSDADISVQVKYVSGGLLAGQGYGLALRLASTIQSQQGYGFEIDDTGHWQFLKFSWVVSGNNVLTSIIPFTANPAIHQSASNTTNLLEVRMQGAHFSFMVNGTEVGHADDSTYTGNSFGLIGGSQDNVVCTNYKVSTL